MTQRLEPFLDLFRSLGGVEAKHDGRRAAIAALRGLKASLSLDEGRGIAALLEEALAADEDAAKGGPEAALVEALGVSEERARDLTEAAVVASLEVLGPEAAALLAALPERLRPRPRPEGKTAPSAPERRPPGPRTLADGRPGSRNPLAEGVVLPHRHSIVSADDPHSDTRISSVREPPTTATLADGRPGSGRPLSGGGDASN